jgi:ankyrin repeat protein
MSVEWLLEHGVDTSLRNDDDLTPAALANKRGRKDIAEAIDRGARAPPPPAAPPEEPLNNLPAGMQQVLDNEEVD